jgi:hypothetical protein
MVSPKDTFTVCPEGYKRSLLLTEVSLNIGEGPDYWPREQVENHGRAGTEALFLLCKAELGFFSLFINR